MRNRPWKSPGRHWGDRPDVIAGQDTLSEGSWLGLNDNGVVAAILNRMGTLGPQVGKRSRGELVLDALDFADAVDAAEALEQINPEAFRGFNLVIADNRDAYCLYHRENGRIEKVEIPEGLSMLSAHDLNAVENNPRLARYLPLFRQAPAPAPELDSWDDWATLLADGSEEDRRLGLAMQLDMPSGFKTVSSSLIAIPAPADPSDPDAPKPIWRFAAKPLAPLQFQPVDLH